jgi:hypothetical protein
LDEALVELRVIEPDFLAALDKAATALRAFDDDHTSVLRRLEEKNLPVRARDALADVVLDQTPQVGQVWDLLYRLEEVSANARGDNA